MLEYSASGTGPKTQRHRAGKLFGTPNNGCGDQEIPLEIVTSEFPFLHQTSNIKHQTGPSQDQPWRYHGIWLLTMSARFRFEQFCILNCNDPIKNLSNQILGFGRAVALANTKMGRIESW